MNFHPAFDDDRDVWVFDLDKTLYDAENDLFSQIEARIGGYVQRCLNLDAEAAHKVQKRYLVEHGTTLRGLMAHHGVDPYHYLADVHDIDFSPITRDDAMRDALTRLPGRKLVFTNADRPYAEIILERLGVEDQFEAIFDIHEADLLPKPHPSIYDKFIRQHGIDPKRAIMMEDMVRNLVPAHAMGMATVWVNTGNVWGSADYDAAVVHAETPRLIDFLQAYLNR